MKTNRITVQEYLKRNPVTKQQKVRVPKDIANLIEHAKKNNLNDPKDLAEILVMMNSVGINKILDYFK